MVLRREPWGNQTKVRNPTRRSPWRDLDRRDPGPGRRTPRYPAPFQGLPRGRVPRPNIAPYVSRRLWRTAVRPRISPWLYAKDALAFYRDFLVYRDAGRYATGDYVGWDKIFECSGAGGIPGDQWVFLDCDGHLVDPIFYGIFPQEFVDDPPAVMSLINTEAVDVGGIPFVELTTQAVFVPSDGLAPTVPPEARTLPFVEPDPGRPRLDPRLRDPILMPIGADEPQPKPQPALPRPLNPFRDPIEQPTSGEGPGRFSAQYPEPVRYSRPPPRTREKKLRYQGPKWVLDVIFELTEAIDLVEVVYKSIPGAPRGLRVPAKLQYIYDHVQEIDSRQLIINFLANQLEDLLIGRMSSGQLAWWKRHSRGGLVLPEFRPRY